MRIKSALHMNLQQSMNGQNIEEKQKDREGDMQYIYKIYKKKNN